MPDSNRTAITLPAGAVIEHGGRMYRLLHATQVEPYRPGGGMHAVQAPRPQAPHRGGAAAFPDGLFSPSANAFSEAPRATHPIPA